MKIDFGDIVFDTHSGGSRKIEASVRLTHSPTGIAIEVSDTISYFDNREEALRQLTEQLWEIEYKKCIASPYYFAKNFMKVNGQEFKTLLSEEEFNKQFK